MSCIVDSGLDLEVFRKYAGLALPRHVAYPMPTWWNDFEAADAEALHRAARERTPASDLSLYLHVPFCEHECRYCACTRTPLPKSAPESGPRTDAYVAALEAEIAGLAALVGPQRVVRQIHWGGGTPTYLSCQRLTRVHEALRRHFRVADDAEIAIELDPRATTGQTLQTLRRLGFTRASFGVQDFDPDVQEHVCRIQPYALIREMVETSRGLGFASINFDLIYGLPLQTPATIRRTLEQTIELSPDRIAYYQFAQIPDKVAAQRGLDTSRLPDSETKLEMLLVGQQMLRAAGYEFIGLDHFAKPDEPLAVAMRAGTLQRNFQGMTTGGGLDLIGIGASSISQLRGLGFLQNVRGLQDYMGRVSGGRTAIYRGKRLTADDVIRQDVLADLYCRAEVVPQRIERAHGIDFGAYFARELAIMRELEADGLVTIETPSFLGGEGSGRGGDVGRIGVAMPLGRVLMRTIAAVFDAYLAPDAYRVGDRQYFSANA